MNGYVIACFGDPGLLAALEVASGPVLGIAEAAMHAASFLATGFSVVTTLGRTTVISRQAAERLEQSHRVASMAAQWGGATVLKTR